MARRSPARWLAPLALVVFAIAFVVVLGSGGGGSAGEQEASDARPAATQTGAGDEGGSEEGGEQRRSRKTYTVKLGDTPSQIAAENDITLEQLQTLNPDLDPQLLAPGEKIRIRK